MPDRVAVLSCDTDWAAEATLAEAHELLSSFGLPLTYFVTQRYATLDRPQRVPLELGPHPNFEALAPEPALEAAMAVTPGAVSFRAHSLHFTTRLRPLLRRHRLRFSSSVMMYLQPGIRTFPAGYDLVEVPLFWMDLFHLEYCELAGRPALEVPAAALAEPGLKVLAIHPVHLVLNTQSREHYAAARSAYHDPAALRAARSRGGGRGIRDLFSEMVRELLRLDYEFVLLRDAGAALGR